MSTRSLVAAVDNKLVQVNVTAARPSGPGDGVDITTWRTNGVFASLQAIVHIDGDGGMTIASPTGGALGVEIWGYRLAQWWRVGYLNDGAAVDIAGNLQGYATIVDDVGIFDRLAIAGTASDGTAVAKLVPLENWSS
jgi:hypothetical protein